MFEQVINIRNWLLLLLYLNLGFLLLFIFLIIAKVEVKLSCTLFIGHGLFNWTFHNRLFLLRFSLIIIIALIGWKFFKICRKVECLWFNYSLWLFICLSLLRWTILRLWSFWRFELFLTSTQCSLKLRIIILIFWTRARPKSS